MSLNRIEFIDIAKGIAIILVVLGHTGLKGFLSDWIWSFHMPLFFFISGLMFDNSKYHTVSSFLQKRVQTLLVPYIVFTIIVFVGFQILNYPTSTHSVKELIYGWNGIALWFIPVLFFTEIVFYILFVVFNKYVLFAILILVSVIGYYMSLYYIHFYYKLEVILPALFIYGIGYFLKNSVLKRLSVYSWLNLVFLFFFFICVNIISTYINSPRLDLAWNQIGGFLPGYTGAFSGIGWLLCLALYISSFSGILKNSLVYLGRNTFVILAFHQLISVFLRKYLENIQVDFWVNSLIRQMLLWTLLWLVTLGVNNYFSWLLGRKRLS